jgi:RNA polymerase sigma-70 factor (ECF subfamily)
MEPGPPNDLLARARTGDSAALSELFESFRSRLERMVSLRLDPSLRSRLDAADVVQEAWLEIARRFDEWSANDSVPFHVWIRLTTSQSLAQAHRRHLSAHMRDAKHEAALPSRVGISALSAADVFFASATTPTQAVHRDEVRTRVVIALEELDELDREIVALRQFEGLSNKDVAAELGIDPSVASRRFMAALARLRPALQALEPKSSATNA